ncbi:MAG TPA: ATP-binding protein [Kofleriaceae bacterium]|nr:ATP-binding protein [Kofleriaceae bacterium]
MSHRLLDQQLRLLGLDRSPPGPRQWTAFLAVVAAAYHDADRDRDVLQRSLLRSEQLLRQREELAQLLVHDLRNLLTAAEANLEAAGGRDLSESERDVMIGDALGATQRLTSLVGDLLDIGAAEDGLLELERRPTDVAELARRALADVVPNHATRTAVTAEGDAALPIAVDAGLVRRVFENILANAVRYTPADGRIAIALTADERWLRIAIVNDGPTIDAGVRARLFQKYEGEPGNRAGRSFGLGLYFCRMVVEAHGGTIRAAEPAQGARFELLLPR